MRDPESVTSARRAASELERAWRRWRHARGLSEATAAGVTSYVAHSIDHPWGRARVVLGLDADEARALTELLGGEGGGTAASAGEAVASAEETVPDGDRLARYIDEIHSG